MTIMKLSQVTIENGKTEFKSMKQYVEYFNLGDYVNDRKDEELGFGKTFENHVYDSMRIVATGNERIQKTGAEYDLIKGADLKILFDNASISVDIKLNRKKALIGNRYYLKDGLELSFNKEDMFYYPLVKGIEVGFAFRNIRRNEYGYCTLKKPVLIAIFKVDREYDAVDAFTLEAARELLKYIKFANIELNRQGKYPINDCNSFYFTFYNKNLNIKGGLSDELLIKSKRTKRKQKRIRKDKRFDRSYSCRS